MKARNLFGGLAATTAALCIGIAGSVAQAPPTDDPLVRALIDRAERNQPSGEFCASVNWPAGNYDTYKQFLERAGTGTWKLNTFKGGENCQFDRVDVVFKKDGINCVTYTWYACNKGARCVRGTALACKNRQGDWDTENSN